MRTISKIAELDEAVRAIVRPGDHIHLAYSEARPNAAVLALARVFKGSRPGFTLSTAGLVSSQSVLVSEKLVTKVIASFVGDNYPTGGPNVLFQEAIDNGALALEEVTLWTLTARLAAGALGIPFMPVTSLRGSDLSRQSWVFDLPDPAGGEALHGVRAMSPDVTIVHGVVGDELGNVVLSPPYGEGAWGALAARRGVIASVEKLVDSVSLRRYQALTGIPAHAVRAVCEVPFGAHPYGLYSPIPEVAGYVEDEAFILEQRAASRAAASQRSWVDEWVGGVHGHPDYLAKVGDERLQRLTGSASVGSWRVGQPERSYSSATGEPVPAPTRDERMVLEAARIVGEKAGQDRFRVLMTGIGFANLAAWVAHRALAGQGTHRPLMAEIGAYGYAPQAGDPFIFSHRNLPTCTWMTGVTEILGGVLAGDHGGALAVLGAGTVDRNGNMNSSRSASGRFLVGSGGAADIASGAQEVVVVIKHGVRRLVERVPFITCPGNRVTTLVTSEAVLERSKDTGEFVLTHALAAPGTALDLAVKKAVAGIGWDCPVSQDVVAFAEPAPADVALLRDFDPRRAFLTETSP